MPRKLSGFVAGLFCCAGATVMQAQITTLAAFQNCIGPNGAADGYGTTCQLAPATYPVLTTLTIGRSGIVVTGTMSGGPGDTVLQRGAASVTPIMTAASGITNVTISYFTFDGNRYGFGTQGSGISCQKTQFNLFDLDLNAGGTFTVEWIDFINAPDTALRLNGNSTVTFSNFGMGGTGVGPSGGNPGQETGTQTATRFTAAYINGSYNGAWYNSIVNAGTAGITLAGNTQYVYGNYLGRNRYEMSDGSGGGQIVIWNPAAYASVTGNVINGDYWPPGFPFSTATLCSMVPTRAQTVSGAEVNGLGHRFFNNEIEQNTGGGLAINLDYTITTGQITISSANPWYSNDAPRYIEGNSYHGITVLGPPYGAPLQELHPVQGVTLDDVLVSSNAGYGVFFQNTENYGSYIGFINGSCMTGNTLGYVGSEYDQQGVSPLTNLYPTTYTSYRGQQCPQEWVTQTPAPSNMPGWPW